MADLRAATADIHLRMEQGLDLLAAPPDRRRFTILLERFYGFHAAWEPVVARHLDNPAFFEPRRRLDLLRRDLLALGHDAGQVEALPLYPGATTLVADRGSALGSLYVLEGSTLGGKLIARHLQQAAWLPARGLTYFDPYGSKTGAMWQQLRHHVEHASSPARDKAMTAAAIATFEGLHDWLGPASRVMS